MPLPGERLERMHYVWPEECSCSFHLEIPLLEKEE